MIFLLYIFIKTSKQTNKKEEIKINTQSNSQEFSTEEYMYWDKKLELSKFLYNTLHDLSFVEIRDRFNKHNINSLYSVKKLYNLLVMIESLQECTNKLNEKLDLNINLTKKFSMKFWDVVIKYFYMIFSASEYENFKIKTSSLYGDVQGLAEKADILFGEASSKNSLEAKLMACKSINNLVDKNNELMNLIDETIQIHIIYLYALAIELWRNRPDLYEFEEFTSIDLALYPEEIISLPTKLILLDDILAKKTEKILTNVKKLLYDFFDDKDKSTSIETRNEYKSFIKLKETICEAAFSTKIYKKNNIKLHFMQIMKHFYGFQSDILEKIDNTSGDNDKNYYSFEFNDISSNDNKKGCFLLKKHLMELETCIDLYTFIYD